MAAILIATVIWGTTGTAAALAPDVGPLAIGSAAWGIGGILLALLAAPTLLRSRAQLRRSARMVAIGSLSVAVYPLAFYSSMHLAGVAIGTLVSLGSAPVVSAVLERVVEGIPLSRSWVVAVALGIGGSILMCVSAVTQGPGRSGEATAVGLLLGSVAGCAYACFSWTLRRTMQNGVPRVASIGAIFGLGGIVLMPVLFVSGAPLIASSRSIVIVSYMIVVPVVVGYYLFGVGLARVRASTATTLTLGEPAIAALLAVLVLGERLPTPSWVGLGIVGVALAVLTVWGPASLPSRGALSPRRC